MSDGLQPLENFSGIVRLFPLPNLVLFPHVMQPLHIFEPRYRQMAAEALAGDHLLTMALLRPGWEEEYAGSPKIYSTACLGRIVADQKMVDGRYNILLRGVTRVELTAEIQHDKLFRKAHAHVLEDVEVVDPHLQRKLKRRLHKLVPQWFGQQQAALDQVQKIFKSDLPLGTLADILAFTLPLDVQFKQSLLEELDVERRIRSLLGHLSHLTPPAPAVEETTAARKFPPEFSVN